MPDPWERTIDGHTGKLESPPAFNAFALYRDLGPELRSTAEVARRSGKTKALMDRWSGRNSWVARADAYDQHQDEVRRQAHEERVRATVAAIADEADAIRAVAFAPIRSLLEDIANRTLDLGQMTASERYQLARMASLPWIRGVQAGRVALGLSERGPNERSPDEVEATEDLAAAISRLAEAFGIPEDNVVDELARRRAGRKASGE